MIAMADHWTTWLLWWAVLIVGVALTGLYCGLETGIYVINKFRLEIKADAGRRSARAIKRLVSKHNTLLGTILIGTNLSSYAATFAVSAMFLLAGAGHRTEWYTIAIVTPILFIFGDSIPKNVFQRLGERLVYPLWWVLAVSRIVFTVCGVLPLVRGFLGLLLRLAPAARRGGPAAAHEGFAAIVAEGRASGILTKTQSVMADRIIQISRVRLADVMTPLPKAVTAPVDVTRERLIELMRNCNYSRVPLLDETGRVTGVLDIYEVLLEKDDGTPPSGRATEAAILSADTNVTDALYRMQRTSTTMTVVADPTGRHLGIVTVKDLVEEIVGELQAW